MGTVWLAEQTEPVRRRVALKLIKPGLDSAKVIARFEQERQALALMDHPHIAKVLDAGTAVSGRPYFVMELVKGIPITKYCDQEHLTPRQRLELFLPVCHAVQHAHQKGVIHRDLKPSNVLVALYDGRPVVKVIDFGVAKATAQRLADKTVFTEVGSLVGTLEYMAPEQAELNNLDVDTRADVYSLGVLLYELLAGSPPFTGRQLRAAAFTEMLRIIREVEPQKPSTRLSSSEELPAIAARRKLEPKRLTKLVRGDLDWVVMKCLEKERARRYETASAMALDLQHYLADEPVAAGPPSALYRLRKFVRRNRGPVLAGALVLLALMIGIVATTWQAVLASQARELAQTNEGKAIDALNVALVNEKAATAAKTDAETAAAAERQAAAKAEKAAQAEALAKALAQKRLGQVEKANEVLGAIFRDLNPILEKKGGPSLKEQLLGRLDQAAAQLKAEAIGDPVVVARLQLTLADTYLRLGEMQKALELYLKARQTLQGEVGPDHVDTLRATEGLAGVYHEVGRLEEAVPLYEAVLRKRQDKLGGDHLDTLVIMSSLGDAYRKTGQLQKAQAILKGAVQGFKTRFGPRHLDTLFAMNNLALAHQEADEWHEALPLYQQALEGSTETRGPDHVVTLMIMHNLAFAYEKTGQLKTALPLFEKALAGLKTKVGSDHPDTLLAMRSLGVAYRQAGRLDDALPLLKAALEGYKVKRGPDHHETLVAMSMLALAYEYAGQLNEARPLYQQTLEGFKGTHGPDHPDTLIASYNLALAYKKAGQLKPALPLLKEVLDRRRVKLGDTHPDTLSVMSNLAETYRRIGQWQDALPLFKEAVKGLQTRLGAKDPQTLTTMNNLALGYLFAGQPGDALPLLEEAARGFKALDDPEALVVLSNLGYAYLGLSRQKEALSAFEEAMERSKVKRGPDHPQTLRAMNELATEYRQAGKADLGEPLLRDLVAIWQKKDGAHALNTATALAHLGLNLLAQKKYDEAETVLSDCLNIREQKLPDNWITFHTRSLLGAALLGQTKHAEAERLLLEGYEGMLQRRAQIPPNGQARLDEARARLVELYEATGQKEKAAEWRQKLKVPKQPERTGSNR
jgi:tetratricopeptide (TPR) repeat protein/tRNA A-37 threonylcarbamoyl transferase component Bud32